MIQMPLDKKFNTQKIISAIDTKKDVDGLLFRNQNTDNSQQDFIPPTIQSILYLIKLSRQSLVGKKAVIFCNSLEFGESLSDLLKKKFKLKKIIINLDAMNRVSIVSNCDLIISIRGKKHWLKSSVIKKNTVIIDVGISKDKNNKTCGDVHPDCFKKSKYISPVPGGVGPLTVVFLFKNLLNLTKKK